MRFNKIIIGLLFLQVIFLSCQKNEIVQIKDNYELEYLSSDMNEGVTCAHFLDEKIGFAGNNGGIFKTLNNGGHFENVCKTDLPIKSFYFVNKNIGFAVGGLLKQSSDIVVKGSTIYKTTDAGLNWVKKIVPLKDSELKSVYFIDENKGFATGYNLHIKTVDGGNTWTEFKLDFQGLMNKIGFVDAQNGFAIGTYGAFFKTTDQGATWTRANLGTEGHFYDFSFVNTKTGYISGEGEVLKTTDGGATWEILANSPGRMTYIHFVDEKSGIAFGKGDGLTYALNYTLDGGLTWEKETIGFVPIINFPSNKVGYSVMANSIIRINLK